MVSRNSLIPPDGLPLDEAAYVLAPRRLKERAMNVQLREIPSIERLTSPDAAMNYLAQSSRIAFENIAAESKPLWDMRNHLCDRLKKHEFNVTGIRTNPMGRGEIESIPAHFFDGFPKINWHRSILVNFGHRFERVRVCQPIGTQTVDLSRILRPVGASKGGRPETKSLLVPIIRELMQEKQFILLPRKAQFHRLRQEARSRHPDVYKTAAQPSEDTMRSAMRTVGLIKPTS